MLRYFIDFRYEVVERRFQHEVRLLKERIHILDGFRRIFNDLDEAIRIIRESDGREDAAEKLKTRFRLDAVQVDAILDLRLYRLARLEIRSILEELRAKKARLAEIEAILASSRKLWGIVKSEIREVRQKYGDDRRTRIAGRGIEETEFDEQDFIVDEDVFVLLTRDGWIRRVGRVGDLSKVRLRPEDELLSVLGGNTRSTVAFFSNLGAVYTIRINEIPPTRGYGDPIQRFFKFRDGERAIGAVSFDPRSISEIGGPEDAEDSVPPTHAVAVGSSGYALRFALHQFLEPSTRAGRRFARVREGEEIVGLHVVRGDETTILATREGRVILFKVSEVNFLAGPGRGVLAIKLDPTDKVLASAVTREPRSGLTVYTAGGRKVRVDPAHYRVTSRAGRGVQVIKRGGLTRVDRPEIVLPALGGDEEGESGRADSRNGNGNGNGNRNGNGKHDARGSSKGCPPTSPLRSPKRTPKRILRSDRPRHGRQESGQEERREGNGREDHVDDHQELHGEGHHRPQGPRARSSSPRHVHRRGGPERTAPPRLGDPRQLGGRGDQRIRVLDRGRPRQGPGEHRDLRQRTRHPGGPPPGDRQARAGDDPHDAPFGREVRPGELHPLRRPPRGRIVRGERSLGRADRDRPQGRGGVPPDVPAGKARRTAEEDRSRPGLRHDDLVPAGSRDLREGEVRARPPP